MSSAGTVVFVLFCPWRKIALMGKKKKHNNTAGSWCLVCGRKVRTEIELKVLEKVVTCSFHSGERLSELSLNK